ncbi:Gfo/Idh/MocA family protein [Microbacterium jiangjiandongii]|uniref:Gfo/Idh/MocA family protein n=1 Tax=Microbacterium jiangjiandongii TaxID=3049071 RepID=UPI00214B73E3|nr:Gfo/Idh/MocA family oxidoreductase [Microbacterium sp. zg.Y843]MCR2816856.1 Gfo/Idh/MocA family oxidoreductase [Microbacterium sp. zg.Y843]
MTRARTIIIGPTHWHVPLYSERIAARHDVIAVSDPDTATAQQTADAWEAPLYGSWRELLAEHPDVDLAYVFAAHDTMRDVCLALVDARIPFVVEKPAGISLDHLKEIARAATEAGVAVAVPLVQQTGPVNRWLSQAGRSVYESAQFIAGPPVRYLTNGSPWMVEPERSGGGCMMNLAPHFVDLFLQSSGARNVSVSAVLSSSLHQADIEDFASLTLRSSDGRIATIEVGYAFPASPLKRHCSFLRVGESGCATVWSDGHASFTSQDGYTENATIDVDSDPLYGPFVDAVADRLGSGFDGLPGLEDLQATMAIIWDAYSLGRERAHDVDPQH